MPQDCAAVLCLASASPRRRELLDQLGVPHRVAPAACDETPLAHESAADCVQRLALAKAHAVGADPARSAGLPVLGADTTVVVDGVMLGKPADRDDGCRMLARLSGRTHEVLSAVALLLPGTAVPALRVSRTEVRFRALGHEEIAAYWDSGEPLDKAGGYAIQGFAAAFVESICGSYSGVVGLPLYETAQLLNAAGVPIWRTRGTREGGA
jgi:septum formation protein